MAMVEAWTVRVLPNDIDFISEIYRGKLPIAAVYHGRNEEAHLAAAAPALLAALKDALRSSRKDFKLGPDGDRQHREAYSEQFAAVALAELV